MRLHLMSYTILFKTINRSVKSHKIFMYKIYILWIFLSFLIYGEFHFWLCKCAYDKWFDDKRCLIWISNIFAAKTFRRQALNWNCINNTGFASGKMGVFIWNGGGWRTKPDYVPSALNKHTNWRIFMILIDFECIVCHLVWCIVEIVVSNKYFCLQYMTLV